VRAVSVRAQNWIVAAALASYWLGFALFPPAALGINDEVFYVHQAQAFAQGPASKAGVRAVLRKITQSRGKYIGSTRWSVDLSVLRPEASQGRDSASGVRDDGGRCTAGGD
jgi:hypothetical protein